jgi:flagellar motor switch protein FliM
MLVLMRIDAKLEEIRRLLEERMAKRKRTLTPAERARVNAELNEVQREVRALMETLRLKIAKRRPPKAV